MALVLLTWRSSAAGLTMVAWLGSACRHTANTMDWVGWGGVGWGGLNQAMLAEARETQNMWWGVTSFVCSCSNLFMMLGSAISEIAGRASKDKC